MRAIFSKYILQNSLKNGNLQGILAFFGIADGFFQEISLYINNKFPKKITGNLLSKSENLKLEKLKYLSKLSIKSYLKKIFGIDKIVCPVCFIGHKNFIGLWLLMAVPYFIV